jgi:hypothetical protein
MVITSFSPEIWLESAMRGIVDYAREGFHKSVRNENNDPVGQGIYDIVMEFPSTEKILTMMPLARTLIHFEIDDIDDRILGFGDGHHRLNYDDFFGTIQPQEAGEHRIDLDVGVWTSNRAGGVTARLRAYQTLRNLFHGGIAIEKLRDATNDLGEGGVEIMSFTGGRFLTDTVNDIEVFRVIDCTLKVRVFSRTPIEPIVPTIEDILIIPELIIDDHLQLPMGVIIKDYGQGSDVAIGKPISGVDAGTSSDSGSKTP